METEEQRGTFGFSEGFSDAMACDEMFWFCDTRFLGPASFRAMTVYAVRYFVVELKQVRCFGLGVRLYDTTGLSSEESMKN
jgi:hypothetical protein